VNDKAYALAVRPPGGGPWQFLSAAAVPGNLMKTSSPFHARTWGTVPEIESWVEERHAVVDRIVEGGKTRAKPLKLDVVEEEFAIVPLAVAVCPSYRSIPLRRLEPKGRKADDVEEYHLQ
jgi:hypothetical protein